MNFYLEYGRLNFSVLKHLTEHRGANVTASDVAYESFLDQLFHSLVSLLVGNSGHVHLHSGESSVRVINPLRRVSGFDRYKFQWNREVDQIKVKVFEAEISQRFLHGHLDMLRPMESIPEL
jgi:hypothetical protein